MKNNDHLWLFKGSQIILAEQQNCPEYVQRIRDSYGDKVDKEGFLVDNIEFTILRPQAVAGRAATLGCPYKQEAYTTVLCVKHRTTHT